MKGKKIGTLFMVSILALAGVGISYAGLTDTITVFGTVNTARVEFEEFSFTGTYVWKVWGCEETEDTPDNEIVISDDKNYDPSSEYPDCNNKLVSFAEASEVDGEDYDSYFEFDELFPQIPFEATFSFKVGTIPVKINELDWDFTGDTDGLLEGLVDDGHIYVTMKTEDGEIVEEGTQLHPSDIITLTVHMWIPQDNAYQNLSGSGWLDLGIVQWTDDCNEEDPTGSITVCKQLFQDMSQVMETFDNGGFEFTVTYPDATTTTHTLPDEQQNWCFTLDDLELGSYTITETVPTGWQMYDIQISGDYTGKTTTSDSITFNLLEGHVDVTFINDEIEITPKGSIQVVKITDPTEIGDDIEFEFNVTYPDGTYSEHTLPDPDTGDLNFVLSDLELGTYTITESTIPSSWVLEDIEITGDSDNEDIDVPGNSTTFDLVENGDDILAIVTFSNKEVKTLYLPETCSMILYRTGEAYFSTTIDNFDPEPDPSDPYDYVVEGGSYRGWCIEHDTLIDTGNQYDGVELYSTYPGDETWLPGGITEQNWKHINYIINHKESSDGYPLWKCVTWAIWYFSNGQEHPDPLGIPGEYPGGITAVENMIQGALDNPDWVPGPGQYAGVIMYYPGVQLTIIEVDP